MANQRHVPAPNRVVQCRSPSSTGSSCGKTTGRHPLLPKATKLRLLYSASFYYSIGLVLLIAIFAPSILVFAITFFLILFIFVFIYFIFTK